MFSYFRSLNCFDFRRLDSWQTVSSKTMMFLLSYSMISGRSDDSNNNNNKIIIIIIIIIKTIRGASGRYLYRDTIVGEVLGGATRGGTCRRVDRS